MIVFEVIIKALLSLCIVYTLYQILKEIRMLSVNDIRIKNHTLIISVVVLILELLVSYWIVSAVLSFKYINLISAIALGIAVIIIFGINKLLN